MTAVKITKKQLKRAKRFVSHFPHNDEHIKKGEAAQKSIHVEAVEGIREDFQSQFEQQIKQVSHTAKWLGFGPTELYLPKNCDWTKWSVIASDQHFDEPEYWHEVDKMVGDAPSTRKLIWPEALYREGNSIQHQEQVAAAWNSYLKQDLFEVYPDALVYVERWLSDGRLSRGLVGAIDLEQYNYMSGGYTLIRTTESVIRSRLQHRLMLRCESEMEVSHARLFIDDPEQVVIEHLTAETDRMKKLYDFDLMKEGGHVIGYLLTEEQKEEVSSFLCALADPDRCAKRYHSTPEESVMLCAVGDGNHYLATAKIHYEELKDSAPDKDWCNHPARYAMVELVNLWEDALQLETVHRVCCNVDLDKMWHELLNYYPKTHFGEGKGHTVTCVWGKYEDVITIPEPFAQMAVESLQGFIDYYLRLKQGEGGYVDYVVDEQEAREIAKQPNCVAFLFKPMKKDLLFPAVILDGVLPRMAFSIGKPENRRFYIEARRIK